MLQLILTIQCFEPDMLASSLLGQFGERLEATADAHAGDTSLWVSGEGSWTLVQIIGGKACVVAAGDGWRGVPNV